MRASRQMEEQETILNKSSGTLYRVALVQTDILKNGWSSSSGFHSCVAMEAVLLSLSIEGHY
jgi:hypothetical protein